MAVLSRAQAFPFDDLGCTVELGGWWLSGGQQGVFFRGTGYEFSEQEATSGTSYQEYSITNVEVSYALYTYAADPENPWPNLKYTITVKRASMFYINLVIVPGVVCTFLSFAVFWADTASSDSLGYGITVIVVMLLLNVTSRTARIQPSARYLAWRPHWQEPVPQLVLMGVLPVCTCT